MNFAVVWANRALLQLAGMLAAATDQAAVSDASSRVDQLLAADPLGQGEDRGNDTRLLTVPPIAVVYHVDAGVGVVHVVSVGWSGGPV